MKTKCLFALSFIILHASSILPAHAQGTAFTYQGRLNNGTNPANGRYDFQFTLYDDASDPLAGVSITNTLVALPLSNGLFTVSLDFGDPDSLAIFDGQEIWLGIAVRTNNAGSNYLPLLPRQKFTATPYAITAANLGGTLSSNSFSGIYSSAVTLNNSANHFTGAFTGNGANVTNVNATKLGGIPASSFWQTGGNAGTFPGANILGTLDNQPLELWVNGARAFKIIPTANTANIIGGSTVNIFDPGIVGATIAGGGGNYQGFTRANYVRADFASIGGGGGNIASNVFSTVAGGLKNIASGPYATVAGGGNNAASGFGSVIGGGGISIDSVGIFGYPNTASGKNAVIGGGIANCSSGDFSFIGGGYLNTNSSFHGTIGGGFGNIASGLQTVLYGAPFNATVGGGYFNTASGNASTVSGGEHNTASDFWTTVGGGQLNTADGSYSTVSGGYQNSATNNDATIGGGYQNRCDSGTVSGGYQNTAGDGGAIGGGARNTALGTEAVVGGGVSNNASGTYSMIPGGYGCTAAGPYSFAAGRHANAAYQGSFVWCDSLDQEGGSVTANSFTVRASGGVYLFTSAGSTGVQVGAGGGSWSSISDRNVKDNFQPVNTLDILKKVTAMPLTSWNYKTQDKTIRHIGPMAQDFYAAFNIGEDDHHITTVDADGVALAAIQGLNQKLETEAKTKDAEIQNLEKKLDELKAMVKQLAEKK